MESRKQLKIPSAEVKLYSFKGISPQKHRFCFIVTVTFCMAFPIGSHKSPLSLMLTPSDLDPLASVSIVGST